MTVDKPIKVEKWDHNAVRIAMDDAAKKAILKLDYEENFRLVDTRLLISTIAVLFALFALAWDYFFPFPESRPVLLTCALSYFALMGVFTVHANYFEKNIFLVAHQRDANKKDEIKWTLSSTMLRFDKNYTLTIAARDKAGESKDEKTLSVGEVIDENGVLLNDLFEPIVIKLHNKVASSKKRD